MQHWLMKSEPEVFSIDDLAKRGESLWDGVRNYQARNFMMKDMQIGDEILFYHSSCEPPGVAGRAVVAGLAEPDPSQFDKKSEYYEPKATREKPIWFAVKVGFEEKFTHFLSLEEIRHESKLGKMLLLKRGQRLSIQPVTAAEFQWICKLARR
jgi:predicted RNA-binding protein with PUA-like domain